MDILYLYNLRFFKNVAKNVLYAAIIKLPNNITRTVSTNILKHDPLQLIKQRSSKAIEFKNVPENAIYRIVDHIEKHKRFIDY